MELLLHMCCAPCAVYPADALRQEDIRFTGLFYNPNIHPRDEYERRRENVEKFSRLKGIPVLFDDEYRQEAWERYEGTGEQRCGMCYALRMDKAAAYAKEKGFDAFTTTLLVSPYQKHDLIRALGEKAAEKYGVEFLYRDFRPGFRQGQQQARELELYRQKFCGCIVSYNASPFTKKGK